MIGTISSVIVGAVFCVAGASKIASGQRWPIDAVALGTPDVLVPIDILAQVGLVVLVGLACKNAILIVEYARDLRHKGMEIREATRLSCKLRFRPIIMTSLAFILGVFPLVVARGAGAEMRWSLGITVFSGMIGVTLFGTLLTPVFYQTMESISTRFSRKGRQG